MLRGDGDYDSAASRLYYAMFYCAEAALLSKGFTYKSHGGVLAGFGQHLARTGEFPIETHRWLLDAFDKSQLGDYVPVSSLDAQDIEDLQSKAEEFVRYVETFLNRRGFL